MHVQSKPNSYTNFDSDQEEEKDASAFLPEIIWSLMNPTAPPRGQ